MQQESKLASYGMNPSTLNHCFYDFSYFKEDPKVLAKVIENCLNIKANNMSSNLNLLLPTDLLLSP